MRHEDEKSVFERHGGRMDLFGPLERGEQYRQETG
jgi:hypothetical protein